MVLLHDPRLLGSEILRPQQLPDLEMRSGSGTRLATWGLEPAGSQGPLVCRIEDMARLASLLLRRRLVTVLGPPGIGKSRLVSEYRRATSGPDDGGDWIQIDLGALRDESELLREVALRCAVEPGLASAERLSAALRSRDSILVFDGAERLPPPLAALCDHLMEACPRLRLLVTSRQALGLDAEATLDLGPLSLPELHPFDRQAVLRSAAVALFLDKACPGTDSSEVADDFLVTAAQICRELDGVPLALELAGATARTLPWNDVRDGLAAGLRGLAVEGTGSAAVLAPLATAIEWSYQMLTPEQQRLLCALSVFEGAFDLEAVRVAAGRDKTGALQAAGLLSQLVACSLVARDRGPSQQPYRLLAPVRHFVRSRATANQAGSGDAHRRRGDHRLRRVG
jgi:non-specific serine/threonine protein kinase